MAAYLKIVVAWQMQYRGGCHHSWRTALYRVRFRFQDRTLRTLLVSPYWPARILESYDFCLNSLEVLCRTRSSLRGLTVTLGSYAPCLVGINRFSLDDTILLSLPCWSRNAMQQKGMSQNV